MTLSLETVGGSYDNAPHSSQRSTERCNTSTKPAIPTDPTIAEAPTDWSCGGRPPRVPLETQHRAISKGAGGHFYSFLFYRRVPHRTTKLRDSVETIRLEPASKPI